MPNVIITNKCNLNCPFCFASEKNAQTADEVNVIDSEELWKITKILDGTMVRFCGGEPTLHPRFLGLLSEHLENETSQVMVMTNGLWPKRVQKYISELPIEKLGRIRYLFNVLEPDFYTAKQIECLHATLRVVVPPRATLGLTIYKKNFDYTYLIQLASQYGIKSIRYSVASPNIDEDKNPLVEPEDFREIADVVYNLVVDANREGIAVNNDCGYLPPCSFSKKQLVEMLLNPENTFKFNCSRSPVDIGKGGEAWRCYGLASLIGANITDFETMQDVRNYLDRRTGLLDDILLFEQCENCYYKQKGICGGGCYSYRVIRARSENPDAPLIPINDDSQMLGCRPVPGKGLYVWKRRDEKTYFIKEGDNLYYLSDDEDVNRFLDECNSGLTMRDLIDKWAGRYTSWKKAKKEILEYARELFEAGVISFRTQATIKNKTRIDYVQESRRLAIANIDISAKLRQARPKGKPQEQRLSLRSISCEGAIALSGRKVLSDCETNELVVGERALPVRIVSQRLDDYIKKGVHRINLAFAPHLSRDDLMSLIQ